MPPVWASTPGAVAPHSQVPISTVGVPLCFTTIGLYGDDVLKLPLTVGEQHRADLSIWAQMETSQSSGAAALMWTLWDMFSKEEEV